MSDQLERELSAMLHNRAAGVVADTEVPGDLEPRVRRAHTRRNVAYGGAIAAALLIVVGTAAVLIDRGGGKDSVQLQHPTTNPAPTLPPTTAPEPTTTPTVPPPPMNDLRDRLVVRIEPQQIVLANADGTIDRELVRLPESEAITGLDLVGDWLWFKVHEDDKASSVACATLRRVPLAGGEQETIVERTYAFAVSRDGTRVAYGSAPDCGQDVSDSQPKLIIRDLDSGRTQELTDPRWSVTAHDDVADPSPTPDPISIAWAPDGKQLAVGWSTGNSSFALVDTAADGSVPVDVPTWPGFAPAYVRGALWFVNSPGNGGPEQISRLDLQTREVVAQPSPFSPGISALLPGTNGSLYAVTGAFEGGLGTLERWDLVGDPVVVIDPDFTPQGILTPGYAATG